MGLCVRYPPCCVSLPAACDRLCDRNSCSRAAVLRLEKLLYGDSDGKLALTLSRSSDETGEVDRDEECEAEAEVEKETVGAMLGAGEAVGG